MQTNLVKRLMTLLLAVIISFCASTTTIYAGIVCYEKVDWKSCIKCLSGCKLGFDPNAPNLVMPKAQLSILEGLVKGNELENAYYFVGNIYVNRYHGNGWDAVNCCRANMEIFFKEMLDEFVKYGSEGSIVDYDVKKWVLISETAVIVAVSVGIIVYKKKPRLEDEKLPVE